MNDGLSRDTPLFLFIHFLQPFSCNHENGLNKARFPAIIFVIARK